MRIPIYQIDAFTDRLFAGNPAAVCPLDRWLPDEVMQAIAAENNLSETAFLVSDGDHYRLRWFTPSRRGGAVRPRHARQRFSGAEPARSRARPGRVRHPERAARGGVRRRLAGAELPVASTPVVRRAQGARGGARDRTGRGPAGARVHGGVPGRADRAVAGSGHAAARRGDQGVRCDRDRARGRLRLRVQVLRARGRNPGGSGHRVSPLCADAVLGGATRQARTSRSSTRSSRHSTPATWSDCSTRSTPHAPTRRCRSRPAAICSSRSTKRRRVRASCSACSSR